MMDAPSDCLHRIVVLARPALGRAVETALRAQGHEVFRTPDDAGLSALIGRVRPGLVIIAVDLPWADAAQVAELVRNDHPTVPLLLIGPRIDDAPWDDVSALPMPIDPARLRQTVAALLTGATARAPGEAADGSASDGAQRGGPHDRD